jgi:histone deacetylase 6
MLRCLRCPYSAGTFYPCTGKLDECGTGRGLGFNVNIPFNGVGVGDADYLAAFKWIVIPIAKAFKPELILVSAGFDAALGDPLGAYKVSPAGYARMTHKLMTEVPGAKLLFVLEGGYKVDAVARSVSACVETLMGKTVPKIGAGAATPGTVNALKPVPAAASAIFGVYQAQKRFWKDLPEPGVATNILAPEEDFDPAFIMPRRNPSRNRA